MKIVSLIATALVAVSANAGTFHNYDAALRGIKLNNACITATEVKSIVPQEICTNLVPVSYPTHDGAVHTEWVCQSKATVSLAFPRAYNKTVCDKLTTDADGGFSCAKLEQVADVLPAVISVRTESYANNGEIVSETKAFAFPACK